MVHVALRFDERPEVAYVLPISVDGMLIVASTVMVDDQRAVRPVRWSAQIAFLAGVTASVAANITAAQPTLGARIVAARPRRRAAARRGDPVPRPASVSRTRGWPGLGPVPTQTASGDGHPALAATASTPSSSSTAVPSPQRRTPPSSAWTSDRRRRREDSTSEAVSRMCTDDPHASTADIATQLEVTERHVRRLLNAGATQGPIPDDGPS
ncbi:DUF2637 domain-containing protein [Actinoplanes sp. NPDC049265]|uniref:DUF2637 domain-containing protein n=1 Tax=Actinoplanes sp. NPDC049265 TaxID=3363902 RepID=UPI003717D623